MLKCHQWLTLETCIRVFPCRSQFLVAWLKGVHRLITVATFLKRDQINFFLGNNSGHMFASIVKPFDDYRWYQKFFLRPPCLAKSLVKSFVQQQGGLNQIVYYCIRENMRKKEWKNGKLGLIWYQAKYVFTILTKRI